jgi:hypothetical protein
MSYAREQGAYIPWIEFRKVPACLRTLAVSPFLLNACVCKAKYIAAH